MDTQNRPPPSGRNGVLLPPMVKCYVFACREYVMGTGPPTLLLGVVLHFLINASC